MPRIGHTSPLNCAFNLAEAQCWRGEGARAPHRLRRGAPATHRVKQRLMASVALAAVLALRDPNADRFRSQDRQKFDSAPRQSTAAPAGPGPAGAGVRSATSTPPGSCMSPNTSRRHGHARDQRVRVTHTRATSSRTPVAMLAGRPGRADSNHHLITDGNGTRGRPARCSPRQRTGCPLWVVEHLWAVGHHLWVVERTFAGLHALRRLRVQWGARRRHPRDVPPHLRHDHPTGPTGEHCRSRHWSGDSTPSARAVLRGADGGRRR
jgi:hypothetical protein